MSNTIIHKTSSVAGKIPTTTDLSLGELAANTNDGLLFLKKDDGSGEEIVIIGQLAHDLLPQYSRIYFPRTRPIPEGWYNVGDDYSGELVPVTNVASDDFILKVKTDNTGVSSSAQMLLPAKTFRDYDFTIDWGDGTVESLTDADITTVSTIDGFLHTYSSAGTYTIRITGTYEELTFIDQGDKLKLVEVCNWGSNPWYNLEFSFSGCENAYFTFGDIPNLGTDDDFLDQMFKGCTLFNASVAGWDLTGVTKDAQFVFNGCEVFEGVGVETWDVSGITDMKSIFNGALVFNGDVSSWDVSSVTTLDSAFKNARDFNADISGWTTTSLTNCQNMLHDAVSFDHSLGSWDISGVTNMIDMLDDVGMSTDSYDATLIGWAAQTVQPNVTLGAKNCTYSSAAASARSTLTSAPNNWTIDSDIAV